MTAEQRKFLYEIARWKGIASPRDLGPQTSQKDNSVRQTCKRKGWVTFDGGYWRLTVTGRAALKADEQNS